MAELLLVNPHRRRRRNPKRARRKHHAKAPALIVARRINPRRRSVRGRARLVRRRAKRAHRAGIAGIKATFVPNLKAGAIGAAGALGLDVLMGALTSKFTLPPTLQSGWGKYALKIAGAVGVGVLGSYVLRGRGAALSQGALTVVLHDIAREQLTAAFPSLPMGEYLTFAPVVGYDYQTALPGSTGMGEYLSEYVTGNGSGVAYDGDYYGGS
jgi:hypothetical protein